MPSSLAQVDRSTHLPPLSLSVMVLKQALVVGNSILAVDEAGRRSSVSICGCERGQLALLELLIACSKLRGRS
jgi:hypothetical protein